MSSFESLRPLIILVFLCLVLGEQFVLTVGAFFAGILLAQKSPETAQAIIRPLKRGFDSLLLQVKRIDVKIQDAENNQRCTTTGGCNINLAQDASVPS